MNIDAMILGFILVMMFFVLIKEWLLPEFTVFLSLSALIFTGILTPAEALDGFSNPGVHTVAFLFIFGAAVGKSGILNELVKRILSQGKKLPHILLRLMLPISALSAFINNTPIVTMLIPTLQTWAVSNHIKPSKLLIPLSYAAILGGTITLIGTSTNLIVQGLLLERGLEGFHLFDFAFFGIPLALAGILYFAVAGHYLLPSRPHNIKQFQDEQHLYIYKFAVEKNSPLAGKTIKEAMLRNLNQLFLIEIIRNGRAIIPAPNDEIIQSNDILVFSGNPKGLSKISNILGLAQYTEEHKGNHFNNITTLFEVGISGNSPLVNKKIKESHFRSKYNAAIVAVKRKSKQITNGIGNIVIKPGDTLLLLAKKDFEKSWTDTEDFYFIFSIDHTKDQPRYGKIIIILILFGLIISSFFQLLPVFNLTLIATVILLMTKVLTVSAAIKAINWNVIILMSCAIGIGKAVEKTGLAQMAGEFLINIHANIGIMGTLILFYLLTVILTEVLNNLATAALMFPIGFSISQQLNLDPMMFAMITAIAASCSFLTPIGYQTNLLVYGPGGYKFTDYLKVGLPLSLISMVLTLSLTYLKWL
ncbi:di/tricarboxylate transporter [Cytobacillus oceanisediminis]|uniref:Di/tricarboxylate transporter n=1 Tax=Cytobacillus oceanisediminis TaxID=665099 RepID=A0A2V3A6X5_9BACI|nr:SLC13 family permease [Cytobacillus oceanisediminis]PWW31931.1 di/tricarboxylate transporter [Cytobacillus oceanisediminis]